MNIRRGSLALLLGLLLPVTAHADRPQLQATTNLVLSFTPGDGLGLGLELAARYAWQDDLTPLTGAGGRVRWLGARRFQGTAALIGGVGGVEMASIGYYPWWYTEVWAGGTWTRQARGPSLSLNAAKNLRRYFSTLQSMRGGAEFFQVQLNGSATWDLATRQWIDPTIALGPGMCFLPLTDIDKG